MAQLGEAADSDRGFASDLACAGLLILNRLCMGYVGLAASRGTQRAINRAIVETSVRLLDSLDAADRPLAAQVFRPLVWPFLRLVLWPGS